jgi:hypothetical protein
MNDERNKNIVLRAERILNIAKNMAKSISISVENRIEGIRLHHHGYAEPGYDTPACGIVATGDWNTITSYDYNTHMRKLVSDLPKRVGKLFEKMGIECEWDDEWSVCDHCSKLIRIQPDSYGWTPSYHFSDIDCDLSCLECIKEDAASYLEEFEGDSQKANPIKDIDPSDYGYIKVNNRQYTTGLYFGQTDSPEDIARELEKSGINRYLFNLDESGQFHTKWSVYVHESQSDRLNLSLCKDCEDDGDDCEHSSFHQETFVVENKNDHPCKCCGTGLNAGETPCWKCGTEDPTIY